MWRFPAAGDGDRLSPRPLADTVHEICPVHFAGMMTLNVEIALISLPVGMNRSTLESYP